VAIFSIRSKIKGSRAPTEKFKKKKKHDQLWGCSVAGAPYLLVILCSDRC